MTTTWMIKTNSDPLGAARGFLDRMWQETGLEGMLLPRYQAETGGVVPSLVQEPADLATAYPFAPLVAVNAARQVAQLAREQPASRFAAVLRPCEARALRAIEKRSPSGVECWLIVGTDCLASFPAEDYAWRLERAGGVDGLTREALKFARQGGIAPYRYRLACQMCADPACQGVDLAIELLGLPVNQLLLVNAKNESTATRLHLSEITDGPAKPAWVAQRAHTLDGIRKRHASTHDRLVKELAGGLPTTVGEFVQMLAECLPCQSCLEACPIYSGELASHRFDGSIQADDIVRWLADCVECGLCDEACPKNLPITAIVSRLTQEAIAV
jgi:formate dehydrogenase subunit beta